MAGALIRRRSLEAMLIRLTPNASMAMTNPRPRNAILIATAIEVHCPYCDAAQPAPGGSEFCEVRESKEMCDGSVKACVACDAPIRMVWHDKVQVGL